MSSSTRLARAAPALCVLAIGLAVLCLRPPLPIDETRYLEVFRESLEGSPLLLRLCGEPYAEKPPLLFWLAHALALTGLSPELALRCLPVLVSTLTVLLAERLGRRVGLGLVGWLQAALWIPGLAGQFLIFDPLLALAVWGAVDAWIRRRDVAVGAWSAACLLAKGPVAFLFLVPFLWSTAPLRGARPGDARRAALALVLALVPLAAWALTAAHIGGPAFADALLWERWAGRVVKSPAHARPLFFYVPIVLFGALPATFLLLRRDARTARPPEWHRRLLRSLLILLVVFTLISGKQAHYLVPAAPALALVLAWRLETTLAGPLELLRGVRVQLALLFLLALFALLGLARLTESFTSEGRALIASGLYRVPAACMLAAAAGGWLLAQRARRSARGLLAVSVASWAGCLLPLHWLAGELLFPHVLAGALRNRTEEIALLGATQNGLYSLLTERTEIERLRDAGAIPAWAARNPDGLLIVDEEELGPQPAPGLVTVASDTVHRVPVLLLRAPSRSGSPSGGR